MTDLNIDDCINETCSWSGKPVQADSLALYGDDVANIGQSGLILPLESHLTVLGSKLSIFS